MVRLLAINKKRIYLHIFNIVFMKTKTTPLHKKDFASVSLSTCKSIYPDMQSMRCCC